MSTTYYVKAGTVEEHFGFESSSIPRELREQARQFEFEGKRESFFPIGTRLSNGRRTLLLELEHYRRLLLCMGSYVPKSVPDFLVANTPTYRSYAGFTDDDLHQIVQSGSPFYSKDDPNSPVLLHDKPTRFVWHTVGREFWESLPQDVKVENNNADLKINTLGDLLNTFDGPNSTMEDVEKMRPVTHKDIDPSYSPSWWLRE